MVRGKRRSIALHVSRFVLELNKGVSTFQISAVVGCKKLNFSTEQCFVQIWKVHDGESSKDSVPRDLWSSLTERSPNFLRSFISLWEMWRFPRYFLILSHDGCFSDPHFQRIQDVSGELRRNKCWKTHWRSLSVKLRKSEKKDNSHTKSMLTWDSTWALRSRRPEGGP